MRLYTRLGASSVVHEDDTFDVDENGAVEVPEPLGQRLHATHIDGKQAWETETERHTRLVAAEIERRRDPATLLAAVESLAEKQEQLRADLGG